MNQITFFVGILAQCCFSARVFIQWILSERDKTIVSPTAFWYLSLLGSILMFYYGTMRNDWPIIIGQLATYYIFDAKLLQKSEMRKDIVIELSYRGFSRASDYS